MVRVALLLLLSLGCGCSSAGVAEDAETWTPPQHMLDAEFKAPAVNVWYGDGLSSWYLPVVSSDQLTVGYRSPIDGPHQYLSIMLTRNAATTAPVTETIPACISVTADGVCQNADVRYHEDVDQAGRWFAVDVSTFAEVTVRGRFEAN